MTDHSYTTESWYQIYDIPKRKQVAGATNKRELRDIVAGYYPRKNIAVMRRSVRYKNTKLPNGSIEQEYISEQWEIVQLEKEEYG